MPIPRSTVYNSKDFSTQNKTGIHPTCYICPEHFNTLANKVLDRSVIKELFIYFNNLQIICLLKIINLRMSFNKLKSSSPPKRLMELVNYLKEYTTLWFTIFASSKRKQQIQLSALLTWHSIVFTSSPTVICTLALHNLKHFELLLWETKCIVAWSIFGKQLPSEMQCKLQPKNS